MRPLLGLLSVAYLFLSPFPLFGDDKDGKKPRTDYLGDPLPEDVLLRLGTERLRHPGPIALLRFTPDSKTLISTGFQGDSIQWDVQTGKRVSRPDLPKEFLTNPAAVSADGRHLAVFRGSFATLEVRDAKTGTAVFTKKNGECWAMVAFTRDGKTALALGRDNVICAWELSGGKEVARQKFGFDKWREAPEDPPAPTLAPDGSVLAGVLKEDWGKVTDETRVRFWDPLTGKQNRSAITLPRWWKHWELSADGKLLTVYFWDGEIQIWETEKGKPLPIAKGVKLGGNDVVLLPGKRLAFGCGFYSAYGLDMETGEDLWSRDIAPPFASGPLLKMSSTKTVSVSTDGKFVAVGTNCGHIAILDAATGKPVGFSKEHPGFFGGGHGTPIQFLPDGKTVLLRHTDTSAPFVWEPTAFMWDLVQGKQIRELPGGYPVLSPDGSSVIVTTFTDDKRSLIALDTKTGKELWTSDRRPWLHDIRFAADGRSIAFYEGKRTTQFLDAGAGKTAQTLPFRVSAASPDLKQVLTSKGEYWDVATNTMLWSTEVDVRWLEASRFQAGGKRLLVATSAQTEDKNCVFVLDLATGKTVRSVGGGSDHQFSPDGRAVAYRAYEKDCYGFEVCDLDTGKVVLRRQVDGGVRPKYCAFSLDGRLFACSTSDEVFEFYDMRTGKRLGLPRKHWAYIHSLTFSPDGKTLAVSYNDSTILFWEAPRPTP